jgi:uncharacterized phage-associated protein
VDERQGQPEVSAHDVAEALRARVRGAGVVQVHKWLYYCQGWHLALTGRPLFRERIEAWANGPVVPSVWREERQDVRPESRPLGRDAVVTVDFVVDRYGRLTGKQMIRLTHTEQPWLEASEAGWNEEEITMDSLKRFFADDEEQLAPLRTMARAARYAGTEPGQALLRVLDHDMEQTPREILDADELAERYGIAR